MTITDSKKEPDVTKKRVFFICLMLFIYFSSGVSENFFKKISSSLNMKGEKYLKKAEVQYSQNHYTQAASLYKKYIEKNKGKSFPELYYKVAICYMETDNPQSCFSYIEKAANLKKDNIEYQLLYAECLIMLHQKAEGILIYKDIIQRHPNDYLSFIRLGELLIADGNLIEARKYWKEAIKIDKKRAEAYSLLAESYLKVEKNKLEGYYYLRKIVDFASKTKKQEIENILNRIAGKFRNDFETQYRLRICIENANAKIKLGNYQGAYDNLMECNSLTDISDKYLILVATTCEKLKKHKEAASAYEKCIAIGYEKGEYYYKAALNYLHINKIDTAIVLLKKARNFPETENSAEKTLKQLKIKR